jgi:hypothetical protein
MSILENLVRISRSGTFLEQNWFGKFQHILFPVQFCVVRAGMSTKWNERGGIIMRCVHFLTPLQYTQCSLLWVSGVRDIVKSMQNICFVL